MKIIAILFFYTIGTLGALFGKEIDIYVINPDYSKGYRSINSLVSKNKMSNSEAMIVDSRDGKVVFRGSNNEIDEEVLNFYNNHKPKKNNDIPYALESVRKSILPIMYNGVNLYIINAILYKKGAFDFEKGTPNDAFLKSPGSPFTYISSFRGLPIKTFISTHKRLFIDQNHFNGLKRFYALLSEQLSLNLQTFNTNFNNSVEHISVKKPLDPSSKSMKLSIVKKPPKSLHFEEDGYKITIDRDMVYLTIVNKDRSNMLMYVTLNSVPFSVPCDKSGICSFKGHLSLGNNLLTFKHLDNTSFSKKIVSDYIPDDEVESYVQGEVSTVRVKHSYRPEGEKVRLDYLEDNKTFYTNVKNGYYEFKIGLKYPDNELKLYQHNGDITTIHAVNERLKREEIEKQRRIAEQKRQEALRKQALEEERKRRERLAKEAAINKGINKVVNDTEILINNYNVYNSTLPKYVLKLNRPKKIDFLKLVEYDADNEGFDIYLEDPNGNTRKIAENLIGSGDNVSAAHHVDNPYKDFLVSRVVIVPRSNLGGSWRIDQALVKYYKDKK